MKQKNTEGGADRTAGDRTGADRTAGDRTAGDRTAGDRTAGDRTAGDRTAADRTPGNRTAGDRTAADRTAGDRTAGDRTAGDRPVTNRRKERRRSAVQSAVLFTVMHLVAAGILLWVRAGHDPASFLAKFTLVLAGFELISVIPLWFSLKARLKEIEGGEEDAAAQY